MEKTLEQAETIYMAKLAKLLRMEGMPKEAKQIIGSLMMETWWPVWKRADHRPDRDGLYLVTTACHLSDEPIRKYYNTVMTAWYKHGEWFEQDEETNVEYVSGGAYVMVTAWALLPEAWEQEDMIPY